jgi:tetratricopeptide (TPR) repeat protein
MLANYPNTLALYNILGLCQQAQGKYREAVGSFRKMLSIASFCFIIQLLKFYFQNIQNIFKDLLKLALPFLL